MHIKSKNLKLSTKISIILCGMLFIVFGIFITICVFSAKSAVELSTFAELEAISKANSLEIQRILDNAKSTSISMSNYMIDAYKEEPSTGDVIYDKDSDIYPNLKLSTLAKQIENFMVATAANTVINTDEILAVGALFEPFAYTENQESYSLYITQKNGEKEISNVGDYSSYSLESYYKDAKEKKELIFTKPYLYNNEMMVTASTPIILNGEVKGVIIVDISIDRFDKVNVDNSRYPTIYSSICMEDGTVVYHNLDKTFINQNISSTFKNPDLSAKTFENMKTGEPFYNEGPDDKGVNKYRFYSPIKAGNQMWQAMTIVYTSDVNEASVKITFSLLIMALIALIIIVIITVIILRNMLNPINNVVLAAKDISDGNLDINIVSKSGDEIGILSKTFNETAVSLKTMINEISEILNGISNNDLNFSTNTHYKGNFITIEKSINNIIFNLNDVMGNIKQSANQVSSSSSQISEGAQDLAQGATDQASAVEELLATITEISEQVKKNANDSVWASSKASKVGEEVKQSNIQMDKMIEAMSRIENSSKQISNIIKTIEDIAFQSNLLSLNSAIEAARAGEAGKGFSVVADEIRNLAGNSAEAAKNITALIEDSINAVENGTLIADETAKSLLLVVDGAKEVSITIDNIAQASNEQSLSLNQITQGVEQISNVVQNNSATAEESAAASEELSGQAEILKSLISKFKLKGK